MKKFIKQKLREACFKRDSLNEEMIDGLDMNGATEVICNKMTINSYEEALFYVNKALEGLDESVKVDLLKRIHAPLENLRQEQNKIDFEIKKYHMSGDSIPDEADTYWHQIQTVFCDGGHPFQQAPLYKI